MLSQVGWPKQDRSQMLRHFSKCSYQLKKETTIFAKTEHWVAWVDYTLNVVSWSCHKLLGQNCLCKNQGKPPISTAVLWPSPSFELWFFPKPFRLSTLVLLPKVNKKKVVLFHLLVGLCMESSNTEISHMCASAAAGQVAFSYLRKPLTNQISQINDEDMTVGNVCHPFSRLSRNGSVGFTYPVSQCFWKGNFFQGHQNFPVVQVPIFISISLEGRSQY